MGKPKTAERLQGADLFINSDLSLKQVAEIIKVSPAKVGQWAREDEWQVLRTAKQVTANKLILNNYNLIQDLQHRLLVEKRSLTKEESQSMYAYTGQIAALEKRMNISNYHFVLEEFAKSIATTHLDAAKILAPLILEFLKEKVKKLQGG